MGNPNKQDCQLADRNGAPLIGLQVATITDAVVAHALNATFSDTEAEAALNALGVKVNLLIAALDAHGLTADA